MPLGTIRLFVPPPNQGIRTDIPPHLVPDGFLTDGQNVLPRDNALVSRSGYKALTTLAPFSDAVMGGLSYLDNLGTRRTFAGSPTKIMEWDGIAWTDRTGAALTGSTSTQVRMTVLQTSTSSTVIVTNNTDVPRSVTSGTNSANLTGGVPDKALDVTVTFERVIFGNVVLSGTRAASSVLISDKDNQNSYPTVNRVDLTDTPDSIVAVQALNAQVFAIYKDLSQWIGVGSPNVYPFQFELRSQTPGPVSPASVVVAHEVHYYMGQDGDFYLFDGNRAQSVGTNVRRLIQTDLDFANAGKSHGYFDRLNDEIWWFYVSTNSATALPDSGITYNIRTQAWSPVHRFANKLTTSFGWKSNVSFTWNDLSSFIWDNVGATYPTWASFPQSQTLLSIAGDSTGQTHSFGLLASDNGNSMNISATLPLRAYAGDGELIRVDGIEPFWKQPQTPTTQTLNVIALTTNTLATGGTAQPAQSFSLNTDAQKLASYVDLYTRYLGVQQTVTGAQAKLEFRGLVLYLYQRSVPTPA